MPEAPRQRDDYEGTTFGEDLAELEQEIAERRADNGFLDGVRQRLKDDAPVLDRLKELGD